MPARRTASRATATIDELLTAYLATLGDQTATDVEVESDDGHWKLGPVHSLDLLRSALDGYGYQVLGRADQARFQAAYDSGDEGAFCRMAKPRALVAYLDDFLGYFLVRKVMLRGDQVAEVVEHVRAFVAWLRDEGAITAAAARKALGALATASVDLPAAERLSDILYGLGEVARDEAEAGNWRPYEEIVEDYLVIERVAPGRIWFLDGVGPIKVPSEASALARPGWTINLVLGRRGTTWHVLEVGNVYPETLA